MIRYKRTIDGEASLSDEGLEKYHSELEPFRLDATNLAALVAGSIEPMVSDIVRSGQTPKASLMIHPYSEEEYPEPDATGSKEVRLQIVTERVQWEIIVGSVWSGVSQRTYRKDSSVVLETVMPGAGDNFILEAASNKLVLNQEIWDSQAGRWTVPLFALPLPSGTKITLSEKPVVLKLKVIEPPGRLVSPALQK